MTGFASKDVQDMGRSGMVSLAQKIDAQFDEDNTPYPARLISLQVIIGGAVMAMSAMLGNDQTASWLAHLESQLVGFDA